MALKHSNKVFYTLGLSSLLFLAVALFIARRPLQTRDEMLTASRRMKEVVAAVRDCREAAGIPIDPLRDINRTGLIGLETSPITTSLGNLEAKRTTVNPNFAGLIVLLLHQAEVSRGDTIAVGASSSFPGLIIATLSAARAMGLRPLLICSLGASQWGANNPGFHWLEILDCLERSDLMMTRPIALSLGGEGDDGKDMNPEGRELLVRAAGETGLPFLSEPTLERNVEERLRLFETAAGEAKIRAFINVGGGYANMGTDSEILKVTPGLAVFSRVPPRERRGMIFEMAARRVPVIHLLYIKGLCDRYGLPWDPAPLPEPGEGEFYKQKEVVPQAFLILAGAYFLLIAIVLAIAARS
ncbi:MAG: poly-gamma-glutamate system protein [Candidatus Aminicenantales bacterium]